MPYSNPKEIEPFDFEKLLSLSLAEQDGKPVLHLDIELRPHRQYDAEPSALFLPGVDPRRLLAPEPVDPVAEQTDKQEVVKVDVPVVPPADDVKQPANGKKSKASSDASQDIPPAGETPKTEESAPAVQTGQGG